MVSTWPESTVPAPDVSSVGSPDPAVKLPDGVKEDEDTFLLTCPPAPYVPCRNPPPPILTYTFQLLYSLSVELTGFFFFFWNIPHGKLAIWLKLSVSHQSVSFSTILWNLHWDGVSLAPSPRSLTPLDIASFTVKCSYCNSEWNRGFHNETPEIPFQGKSQDFIWCTTIFSLVNFQ